MKLRGTPIEEYEDVIEDLEIIGYSRIVDNEIEITEEWVSAFMDIIPLYVSYKVVTLGADRAREEMARESTVDILTDIALHLASGQIIGERVVRGVRGIRATYFEKEYIRKLGDVCYNMVINMPPDMFQEAVDRLNRALMPLGIKKEERR